MDLCSTHSLERRYHDRLAQKLAVIEEVRQYLGKVGIKLPGIAVIGMQSVGKSTVLERLTGISFPSGKGTCTRAPTVVHLQVDKTLGNMKALISSDSNFASAKQFNSMKEVREALINENKKIEMRSNQVSKDPIHVRCIQKTGPVMTIADLPGITHGLKRNDRFHNITTEIVHEWASNEKMILLPVLLANDEFTNSKAYNVAREYDKDGSRTIVVVSKCDGLPKNSGIVEKIRKLQNSPAAPLAVIAVANFDGDLVISSNEQEENVFRTHEELKNLSPEERGYETLINRIVSLQIDQVERILPEMSFELRMKISQIEEELKQMTYFPSSENERILRIIKELSELQKHISKLVRAEIHVGIEEEPDFCHVLARSEEKSEKFSLLTLSVIQERLSNELRQTLKKLHEETKGFILRNFVHTIVLKGAVCKMVFENNLEKHTKSLIAEIGALMEKMFLHVLPRKSTLLQFPNLISKLREYGIEYLRASESKAEEVTSILISAERDQEFTQNPEYLETLSQMKIEIRKRQNEALGSNSNIRSSTENNAQLHSDSENSLHNRRLSKDSFMSRYTKVLLKDSGTENYAIKNLLEVELSVFCYVDIISQRLLDIIPMVVRSLVILNFPLNFQEYVLEKLHSNNEIQSSFIEESSARKKRQELQDTLKSLLLAQKRLQNEMTN